MNKKLLAVAIASTIGAPMAAQALDTKVSGQVNRLIRFADDGVGSDVQFLDNTASRSRFRFNTSGDIGSGVTAGIILEAGMASNASGSAPLKPDGDSDDSFAGDLRHSALYFEGNFGRVTLGHTTESTDGIMFTDLSGTALADEVAMGENAAGIGLRNEVGGGSVGGATIGDIFPTFGGGRIDLLKYDSPALGPVTLSGHVGQDSRWGIAAFASGAFGGTDYGFSVGWDDGGDGNTTDDFGVSASVKFAQGTNVTASYGFRDAIAGDDPDIFYVKLGHMWGNNAASIGYGMWDDTANGSFDLDDDPLTPDDIVDDTEGQSIGVAFVHNLPKPGIELFAGYHYYFGMEGSVNAVEVEAEDVHAFIVGSRIKFN